MKTLAVWLVLLTIGAVLLSPAVMLLGLEPLPGDFTIPYGNGNGQILVPVTYSLCASASLVLLYYMLKR